MAEASQAASSFSDTGNISDSQKAAMGEVIAENAAVGGDWRAQIPQEVRQEKFWENYKTPGDAFKAHAELVKYRGANPRIPDENAKPEEIAAFRKRLGVPDKADGYALKLSETANKDLVNTFLGEVAHGQGFTPKQAQAVADFWETKIVPQLTQPAVKAEDVEAAQKTAWGDKFKDMQNNLDRYVRTNVSEKCAEAFDALPLEYQLEVGAHFAKLGGGMKEDSSMDLQAAKMLPDRHGLERRKAEIFNDPAFHNRSDMRHKSIVEENLELTKKLYGLKG